MRLHSSELVSQIVSARGEFRKNHEFEPLKHVVIFPALKAADRFVYIRPMLSNYELNLLKLASEAKTRFGFKFYWSTDNETILMKRDESSDPIIIRDERLLQALENPGI